ncbi:bifunctional peptidase and arginyl-hydroxylase JMJD5 isoform X2 [Nomascus leucogenys]|uniref:bifunctional peptidase and arginyl-hydroxylase JMJD5 isoform X2 n=1 Tax=Nomascus leucogenys TaxID=61853 RepID=UPI00122DAA45|nr:bifunctional peptidase and arginyl-hydroxylase JMJD5 isoform X2 [Nomascus leucogenys]
MAGDTHCPTEPLAREGTLWEALRALLPHSKEDLKLDLGEKVERSMVTLLQRATELFYEGRRDECLQTSEVILDYSWEKLNTGTWQDVDKDWRRVYAIGCLLKALCLCQAPEDANTVAAALRVCDMGLLMGAAILGDILLKVAAILQTHLPGKRPAHGSIPEQLCTKKARVDHGSIPDVKLERTVPRLHRPSLQHFREQFLVPGRPVILKGVADHWPCMQKWSLEYIQEIAGCRTVPVEVGSRYTDEEWSQTLMTVNEFISKYIVNEPRDVGYLAQHQLFDQAVVSLAGSPTLMSALPPTDPGIEAGHQHPRLLQPGRWGGGGDHHQCLVWSPGNCLPATSGSPAKLPSPGDGEEVHPAVFPAGVRGSVPS